MKKNAVTGAMMLNSNPLHNPTDKTARMMVRFTIGDVHGQVLEVLADNTDGEKQCGLH